MTCSDCNKSINGESKICPSCGTKADCHTKRTSSLQQIIIMIFSVVLCNGLLASVIVPAYNTYSKEAKEKVALNFAATVAQATATYYAQSQVYPSLADLNIKSPLGFSSGIVGPDAVVVGDGSPGFVSPVDLEPQSVRWKE
jgi:hypothetical protein